MKTTIIRGAVAACALVFAGGASVASAQATQVDIAASKDWQHEWTDMAFPAQIEGFEREAVTLFEERETNISARYLDNDSGTILSLYIYRPGNASTAIWFDRALIAIGVTDSYGSVDLEEMKIRSFVPSGGMAQSGLSAVLAVDGNFRSTGVALYRSGEWLVKVRISSQTLSVAQMDAMMTGKLAALPALKDVDQNPAEFIAECSTPIEFGEARPATENLGMTAITQAVAVTAEQLAAYGDEGDVEDTGKPLLNPSDLSYCREGERNRQFNLFRVADDSGRYTVALGDAGFSIDVYPDIVMAELEETGEETSYAVRSASGLQFSLHTPFIGLPNLRQVSQSAMQGPAIATVERPLAEGENHRINILTQVE